MRRVRLAPPFFLRDAERSDGMLSHVSARDVFGIGVTTQGVYPFADTVQRKFARGAHIGDDCVVVVRPVVTADYTVVFYQLFAYRYGVLVCVLVETEESSGGYICA